MLGDVVGALRTMKMDDILSDLKVFTVHSFIQ